MSIKDLRQALTDFSNMEPEEIKGMSKLEILSLLYDQYEEMRREPENKAILHEILVANPPTTNSVMWYEFARRKMRFHPDEAWDDIKLWLLCSWGYVSKLIEAEMLLAPGYAKVNKTIWCFPRPALYELFIEPILMSGKSLEEVTSLAGWQL